MNETTLFNTTTVDDYGETTQAVAVPVSTDYKVEPGVIIGAAVGGACAFTIIILLLVCWIKSKRSNMNPPPTMPHPYAVPRFEYTEPTISDYHSEAEIITKQYSKHVDSTKHTWQVQEPVIHSPVEFSDSDRISYILMSEPSRPISVSPPSPELVARGLKQAANKKPPPIACKSPSGYVNISDDMAGQILPNSSQHKKSKDFNTNEKSMDELSISSVENYPDNYENVQDVMLSDRNNLHNNVTVNERSTHTSHLSSEPPEEQLPDLLTSSFLNKNRSEVHQVQSSQNTPESHQKSPSSSESDASACEGDADSQTSYVNVDQYKIRSPVKESVIIDFSKSKFPEVVNSSLKTESKPQTRTKLPSFTAKPPSFTPNPRPTQYQRITETGDDTYQINADLFSEDKHEQDGIDTKKQDKDHHILSSPTKKGETNTSPYRKVSSPPTEASTHTTPTKFPTTGRTHKKNQLTDAQSKLNQRQRSHSYQNEIGVYQNFTAISASESKLSQLSTSPPQIKAQDFHSRTTSESDTAPELEINKPSVDPSGKIGQNKKTTSQQPKIPAGLAKDINLGNSLNIGSSEEINKIRLKLRKVN